MEFGMSTATASIRPGLPPGPKGTVIGGSTRQFRDDLLDFLLDAAREHGPLASFRVGPRRVFLASGPDLIEQVLVTDAKRPKPTPIAELSLGALGIGEPKQSERENKKDNAVLYMHMCRTLCETRRKSR
jgi:hypothetical protein